MATSAGLALPRSHSGRCGASSGISKRRGAQYRNVTTNAIAFALEQVLYTNPLAVPVWLAGLIAPFRIASLRDLRFISIAYLVLFTVAALLAAKGYYIIGVYGALFGIGAVAAERVAPALRSALFAALALAGFVFMPLSLPLLPVDGLIGYTKALGLTGRGGSPAHLIQPVFAEEFGWDRLARDVARRLRFPTDIDSSSYGSVRRHLW